MTAFIGPAWAKNGEPFLVAALGGPGFPRARHAQRTRIVVDDFGNAVAYERRCSSCWRWLALGFDHFAANAGKGSQDMTYRCGACDTFKKASRHWANRDRANRLKREWYARWKQEFPEAHAKLLVTLAERRRERQESDPAAERLRRRDAARRRRARIKSDPIAHAEFNANNRLYRRTLALERGRPVRIKSSIEGETMGTLPVAPLVTAIEGWLVGRDIEEAGAFLDSRTFRAWREGTYTTTQFDVADRVLIGIDLLWWEVWIDEGHEKACKLFTGEKVAA